MTDKQMVTRRGFLETAGAATGAVVATGAFPHPAIGMAKGANDRINFAILGPGGRAQAHIGVLLAMKDEGEPVDIIAVADVYQKNRETARERTNCKQAENDYRMVLENKDVDAVVIATPDHWHAKMAIDAMEGGKDVFCEKPMTHTIDEARQVTEAQKKTERIFTVGVQSTADPRWRMANEMITAGKIGHVMQGQTSYYRNSSCGQWRYYALSKDMTPETIDWKMFLGTEFGLAPDLPFDRAKFAQWRCYWEFGGGMYTDLFVHQLTHLIQAMGVRFPRRVVGGGGLYLEYDGRDVPDVATVVADFDEGCQVLISATMCNDVQLGEIIRGHTGTIRFAGSPKDGFHVASQEHALTGRPAPPGTNTGEGGERFTPPQPRDDTRALWDHFMECLRSRNPETLCPAVTGYAAIATVNLGVQSYREGKALYFDKETGKVSEADESWAKGWEKMSKERSKPNQVIGWHAGTEGSLLEPKDYQKLEGDWIDGKDPAES
ncbi:MAG TPA: Gfo/Idh/MocA family oxidoreductase [Isosphaeraceae bacterium]|nr:Gfo/Idh/MocA family oxidoreductase [Isosphaeraceae bacterium]